MKENRTSVIIYLDLNSENWLQHIRTSTRNYVNRHALVRCMLEPSCILLVC
jgi:hypothetical protein